MLNIFKRGILSLLLSCCLFAALAGNVGKILLKGSVVDDNGKGIIGVVVNNGVDFTQTDGKGRWELNTDTLLSKFVSVSVPAAYTVGSIGNVAGYYIPVGDAIKAGSVSFRLSKRKSLGTHFYYIAISDPQVKTEAHLRRWLTETCPDIRQTVDSLSHYAPVIGMTLGDLVWDSMSLFPQYVESLKLTGMPVYPCIGNHDFNKKYQDLHNSSFGARQYGESDYGHCFGPVNYSFNIGKVHVVTIKDINYVGDRNYIESVTGQTLAWLSKDLSYVPDGSVVFLNMHAPAWNSVNGDGNVRNADKLRRILSKYKVHVFDGHTHFMQDNEVTPTLYEHNIGAACGAWWKGQVNRCGAPDGFLVVEAQGDSVSWHYKATGLPLSYQLRVSDKWPSQPGYIVANVWDWDAKCRVEWLMDGKPMGAMERFTGQDDDYGRYVWKSADSCLTAHLFRAKPRGDYRMAEVRFTNRFGETFTATARHTQVIAHRGYWDCEGSSQNSVSSLYNAQMAGCYGSEFDVWMTKDGRLVIHHDPEAGGINIERANYSQLKAMTLPNGEPLPTLEDYLRQGKKDRGTKLILEIKPHSTPEAEDSCVAKVVAAVNACGMAPWTEYISFSRNVCRQLVSLAKDAKVSYLNGDMSPAQVKAAGFTGIDYQDKVLIAHPEWIREAHSLGLDVNVWTVNDKSGIQRFVSLGVDFITTNNPVEAGMIIKTL